MICIIRKIFKVSNSVADSFSKYVGSQQLIALGIGTFSNELTTVNNAIKEQQPVDSESTVNDKASYMQTIYNNF